jgi:predicted dehydrogenase
VIGTGGMANWHARHLLAGGHCAITAACDIDRERAAAFAQRYGTTQLFDDYRALVDHGELDAVTIVTPNDMHHPAAMAALRAGLHVLCEKPLALTAEHAQEMASAARQAGVINVVNFTHRNTPCFTLARQIVAAGHLGEIYHVQASYLQDWLLRRKRAGHPGGAPWRTDTAVAGSGQLGDLGSHVLDLLHGLLGDVATVSASLPSFPQLHSGELPPERISDDLAALQLEFAGGAVGQVLTSRVASGMGDAILLQLYGSEGALMADDRRRDELQVCAGPLGRDRRAWTTLAVAEAEHEPTPAQLFVQGILSGEQPPMGFDDGLWVQQVMDAALRSAHDGTRQRVPM